MPYAGLRLKLIPLVTSVGLFNSVVALILWSSSQLSTLANVIAVYLLRDVCAGYIYAVWHVYHRHSDGRSDPILSWQPLGRIRLIGSFTSAKNVQPGVTTLAIPICFFCYSQALRAGQLKTLTQLRPSLNTCTRLRRYRFHVNCRGRFF